MTYEEALSYIAALEPRGWRLGLDRMQEFVRRAGLDDALGGASGPQFIHVAGTNGKGSTTAYLQSLMVEAGHRTGAFFSPYVVDPRERVQFGRSLIGKQELADVCHSLIPAAESLTDTPWKGVTEFEFKSALGFAYWKLKECEWVALEVGLGGRLDATNVVSPRACVITSISLDHTAILGDTLDQIAEEKAGIIKAGVPVVVGQVPDVALRMIRSIAEQREAPIWIYGHEVKWHDGVVVTPRREHVGLIPGIAGVKQEINLSLAVAAMDAAGATEEEDGVRLGAARASAPGRFQIERVDGRIVVFDGAHNPESSKVLAASLSRFFPRKRFAMVTNMVEGHSLEDFYGPLAKRCNLALVPPIDFHRSRRPSETAQQLRRIGVETEERDSVSNALRDALASMPKGGMVLVTGSFYLVGEALRGLNASSAK